MSTNTTGTSDAAMYDKPSCINEIPGLDEEDMARAPAHAAPYTILIAASSLSTVMP